MGFWDRLFGGRKPLDTPPAVGVNEIENPKDGTRLEAVEWYNKGVAPDAVRVAP